MGLRAQAEADLAVTLEAPGDFGELFVLTDPAGFASATPLYGMTGDVGALLDPDTGASLTGRHATLTVRMSSLTAAGYTDLPIAVPDESGLPWTVSFVGVSTPTQLYKVRQAHPDRTLGAVTMVLEFYQTAGA